MLTEKIQLQKLTEDAVVQHLKRRLHTVTGTNVRWRSFEFDIISTHAENTYTHEVRGTRQQHKPITEYFPPSKIIHLLTGIALCFPTAVLLCHLVRVAQNGATTISTFRSDELL